MAKRRNTAALFEVFHDTRAPSTAQSPVASVLSGFRSWFSTRGGRAAEVAVDPNDPTTMPMRSPLIAPRQAPVEAVAIVAPPAPQPAAPRADTRPEPVQRTAPTSDHPATAAASSEAAGDSQAPRHSHFRFDRHRREVTMRLRLNTAVVTCFGILLTVALAYVLGRRAGTRPVLLAAPGQTDSHAAEITPAALDVPRHVARPLASAGTSAGTSTGTSGGPVVKPPRAGEQHGPAVVNPPRPPQVPPVKPATPAPQAVDARRIVGLNYYIIQDSPTEAGAVEARDFFVKNGVACTAERMPAGFNPNLFAVISSQGFEHLSGPECEALKKQVVKVEGLFSVNNKNKRFSPVAFKQK